MAECAAATAGLLAEGLAAGLAADARPGLVVLAGVAGSYVDELKVGDTVAVASETVADLGRADSAGFVPLFQKTYHASLMAAGFRAVRGNTVNTAGWGSGGAEIENMEGAAFFAVCERFGVPAMEVRTISNRVGEPVTDEWLDLAARRLADALKEIITAWEDSAE
jgi:nucleoside phosphorylase